MSKLEKFIIALLIIVVIIIIIICLLIYQKRGEIFYGINETGSERENNYDDTINRVTVRNDFFAVESCINKFYIYYATIYDYANEVYIMDEEAEASIQELQKSSAKAVYDMLDQEYITSRQITENNILTKLTKISTSDINITDMYVSERTDNMSIYIAEGTIREKKTGVISNIKVIVKLDALNRTFTVLPQDYVKEKYANTEIGNKIEIEVPEKIEKNENNMYDLKSITDETYVRNLFNQFKEEVLYNPEFVYYNLDKEYQSKRFENVEQFKTYAKNNIKRYVAMQLDSYQKTKTDNYTQYVLLDTEGRYYIFHETSPMKYTLILDTYTIDIPEFTTKYQESTEQEKVVLNINKFMLAINDKDYKYAYNVLADSFKNTNFPTLESFENYMKTNFFEENKFDYLEFGDQGGTYYTYKVKITDTSKNSNKTIDKTFIMLLEEGTDFVLSFNIE